MVGPVKCDIGGPDVSMLPKIYWSVLCTDFLWTLKILRLTPRPQWMVFGSRGV